MNGTRDAVLQLQVHLWNGIFGEDRGVGYVTYPGRFFVLADVRSFVLAGIDGGFLGGR